MGGGLDTGRMLSCQEVSPPAYLSGSFLHGWYKGGCPNISWSAVSKSVCPRCCRNGVFARLGLRAVGQVAAGTPHFPALPHWVRAVCHQRAFTAAVLRGDAKANCLNLSAACVISPHANRGVVRPHGCLEILLTESVPHVHRCHQSC